MAKKTAQHTKITSGVYYRILSARSGKAMEADAKQRSEAYWTEVSKRLQIFYENHQELKKLLNISVPITQV